MSKQCVLCEFMNEDKKHAIGSTKRIQDGQNIDLNNVDCDQQIVINWPSTGTAEPGKRKKHTSTAKWQPCLVRILACGGKLYRPKKEVLFENIIQTITNNIHFN